MGTIANLIIGIKTNHANFSRGIKTVNKELINLERRVEAAQARMVAMSAGAMVVGYMAYRGFRNAVMASADFEKQMAKVNTMLGESSEKYMPAYTQGIQRLAIQYGESTETLTSGLYAILSASRAPAKAMGVLETSSRAAIAGMTDTGTAAFLLSSALNAYHYSADQANYVSNIFFKTVKKGQVVFEDIAAGFGKIGATGYAAGVPLEELMATFATMTLAGVKAEDAITSLSNVMLAFLKPEKAAADAAELLKKSLDIDLSATTLQVHGLYGTIKKLATLNAADLTKIFTEKRAIRGILPLAGATDKYADVLRYIKGEAKANEDAFSKMANTMSFKLGQAWQVMVKVGRVVGSLLSPAILGMTYIIKGANKAWSILPTSIKKTTLKIVSVIASIAALKLSWIALLPIITRVTQALKNLVFMVRKFSIMTAIGEVILNPKMLIGISIKLAAVVGMFYAADKAVDKLYASEQAATQTADDMSKAFGENTEAAKAFKDAYEQIDAAIGSSNDSLIDRLQLLKETKKAEEGNFRAICDIVDGLRDQYRTYGMTAGQADAYHLSMMGASNEMIEVALRWDKIITKKEKDAEVMREREQEIKQQARNMEQQIKSVFEETRTPQEKLLKTVKELGKLLGKGLDFESYSRAIGQARSKALPDIPKPSAGAYESRFMVKAPGADASLSELRRIRVVMEKIERKDKLKPGAIDLQVAEFN